MLSVPVQVIAWKDSSPKWPVMCRVGCKTLLTHSVWLYVVAILSSIIWPLTFDMRSILLVCQTLSYCAYDVGSAGVWQWHRVWTCRSRASGSSWRLCRVSASLLFKNFFQADCWCLYTDAVSASYRARCYYLEFINCSAGGLYTIAISVSVVSQCVTCVFSVWHQPVNSWRSCLSCLLKYSRSTHVFHIGKFFFFFALPYTWYTRAVP